MKITIKELRNLINETYEGARDATPEEIEYLARLKGIHQSHQPGQSVEIRMEKLEAKVDAILDMLGEL